MCPGFKFAGVAAGLKKNGQKDLALIYSETIANVAGVFTRNQVKAAPVILDMQRIVSGTCQAVVANSGGANCCTGEKGIRDAILTARRTAKELKLPEEQVLLASTGVIGEPLPVDKIQKALPGLVKALDHDRVFDFAEAIMTTDTVPKVASRQGNLDGKTFTVTGIAKGSGMIRPAMATLLCFVMTDIAAESHVLKEMLFASTDRTLNRITVDGDTSTNDTALLIANGLSGVALNRRGARKRFQKILDDVMMTLAKALVKDGEGATKAVEIAVRGAQSNAHALQVAETVAHSNLLKTALFGEDANWGRILAAVGRSGVPIKPHAIDVYFADVLMVKNGMGCGKKAEAQATRILKQPEFVLTIDLKSGRGRASVLTCDFSIDYVKINAAYRS
ncbi:MAG: bifunctional glutamate N-acetyltransferase/amino-acid acetyltransferase ArgJ [Deltaproteobacteria bacterium]|jgi:glutamate N-acetyltransferase/amino-acid N-acetyltransferase|nr:bifunctional glutamate N-acetyltransferase/amino-acid acetyltransferase ArgJ [Deltaproteobacteria bacterium]